jgi:hypothetical protein
VGALWVYETISLEEKDILNHQAHQGLKEIKDFWEKTKPALGKSPYWEINLKTLEPVLKAEIKEGLFLIIENQ